MDPLHVLLVAENHDADGELIEQGTVAGIFKWNPHDPVAVRLVMSAGMGAEITWAFARDLLRDGTTENVGLGDVAVWPNVDDLVMRLTSPEGVVVLTMRRRLAVVRAWVDRTYVALPDAAVDYGRKADQVLRMATSRYTPEQACERNACPRCHMWGEANA